MFKKGKELNNIKINIFMKLKNIVLNTKSQYSYSVKLTCSGYLFRFFKNICIPESFKTNISHQLFDYTIGIRMRETPVPLKSLKLSPIWMI